MPNPSPRVYIAAALISAVGLIIAAVIGALIGRGPAQQQAFATAAVQQATSIAQAESTQIAVTSPPIVITSPPIVITSPPIVVTSPPIVVTATPEPPTPGPTATPTPGPEVLYQADWSNGMNGWAASPSWKTVDGMLITDGGSGNTAAIAPYRPGEIANYAVEVELKLIRGNGLTYGIFVRGDDSGEGYWVGYEGVRQNLGSGATIWSDDYFPYAKFVQNAPFEPKSDWQIYRVEVKGTTIKLLVDGATILEVQDNRYISGGKIGLWSQEYQLNIRNFKITKL
jgi:3-keto-disaccharide hydrolase